MKEWYLFEKIIVERIIFEYIIFERIIFETNMFERIIAERITYLWKNYHLKIYLIVENILSLKEFPLK